MYRALIGHAMQFIALGVGEYALEGQLDVELVFTLLLLSAVVGDLHGHAGQRDIFFLRVEPYGQGFARRQRSIEIIVRGGRRIVTAQALGQVGKQLVIIDIHAVTEVFSVQRINGNRHGKPHKGAG